MRLRLALGLGLALGLALARDAEGRLPRGASAWAETSAGAIRGMTLGPLESALHPLRGYGSAPAARGTKEARRMGATWVSITPFGRAWDLEASGVDPTFEAPHGENCAAVRRAIHQAHAEGMRVMLVPHLWIETGGWRALVDPGTDEGWARWAASYRAWLLDWARLAAGSRVEMLSVGVELRSWVTTTRAPSFVEIVRDVRRVYPGLLTYAANWDDVHHTVILGELDVIGINAFYPLAEQAGASLDDLERGGVRVRAELRELATEWERPIVFTEIGYTTRADPAVRPWEWPDHMTNVVVDEAAQADAYWGLLGPLVDEPWLAGFFVWRMNADPDDLSQEAEWGFNPRGKEAELVLRDAYGAWWPADGVRALEAGIVRTTATSVGLY